MNKLKHQAPIGYRTNNFNSIEIQGDHAYCKSHNFIYNSEIEEEKLYNAIPNYYTDIRYIDGSFNFYKNTKIFWTRFKNHSLKSCIRKALKCKNIPKDTIVSFNKSWRYSGKNIDNSYLFKIKNENNHEFKYEINDPRYFTKFTNCDRSNILVNKLRSNGFIVMVMNNESLILNMINSAINLVGGDNVDSKIDGEIAIAYGHNKIIGFSSFENDFKGYSNGEKNVLWDKHGEFNKWSRCEEISKNTDIKEIIEILKK